MQNKVYDVFISYRCESGGLYAAELIKNYLERHGVSVYMDRSRIHVGDFPPQLHEAIKNSKNVVVVLPKAALNRCTNDNDWLRKEIVCAVREKKIIIPVWLDGYTPSNEEKEQLQKISEPDKGYMDTFLNKHAVHMSKEHFDDALSQIAKMLESTNILMTNEKAENWFNAVICSSEDYFRDRMQNIDDIEQVDMAFHAGAEWHKAGEKLDILANLLKRNIKLRILINTQKAAKVVAPHMRQERGSYTAFAKSIKEWRKMQEDFPEQVEVRMSKIPLLRCYHSFHMKESRYDSLRIRNYTYGNGRLVRDFQPIFFCDSPYFKLYRDEFEFLWNKAEPKKGGLLLAALRKK